jgi:predicted DNA-binding ribbon-helix-helix protein
MAGRASPILRRGRQQRSATTAADAATPLINAIDADRQYGNLSSAIRLFVLGFYREAQPSP